jgi:vacuolar iron transporter family protein
VPEQLKPHSKHSESHRAHRSGWLRAAVLGANDGIISTASLLIGVAAAGSNPRTLFVAGVAGLIAGSMSMAAGEYVSVSSQADVERADLAREAQEIKDRPDHELDELTGIYVKRGLDPALAKTVATQLMQKDALQAHARDELGILELHAANPIQAALVSAASFAIGAVLPLIMILVLPAFWLVQGLSLGSLIFLATLGFTAAKIAGAPVLASMQRVVLWGVCAMAMTAIVGSVFNVNVN